MSARTHMFRVSSNLSRVPQVSRAIYSTHMEGFLKGTFAECMGSQSVYAGVASIAQANNLIRGLNTKEMHSRTEGIEMPDNAIGFVPSFSIASDGATGEVDPTKRSVKLHLYPVQLPKPSDVWLPADKMKVDILRVALVTDFVKLGGLIHTRWCQDKQDSVILNAMGGIPIYTAIKALAISSFKNSPLEEASDSDVKRPFVVVPTNHLVADNEAGKRYMQFVLLEAAGAGVEEMPNFSDSAAHVKIADE